MRARRSTAATPRRWPRRRSDIRERFGGRRFTRRPATSTIPRPAPRSSPRRRTPTFWSTTTAARRSRRSARSRARTFSPASKSNMLTPIALVQALLPGMAGAQVRADRQHHLGLGARADRRPRRVVGRTRRAHRLPRFRRARPRSRDNVTINSIQPGAFATDRQRSAIERSAAQRGVPVETARGGGGGAQPRAPVRRSGRVRRALRVPGERACRLHHRAEHPDRRRRLPRARSRSPGESASRSRVRPCSKASPSRSARPSRSR